MSQVRSASTGMPNCGADQLHSAGPLTIVPPKSSKLVKPYMSEDNIFREVDEELRSDRMRDAWRRFGPYVIAAAVAVVLVVAANEGWNWWQRSNSTKSSDAFYTALDIENGGDIAKAEAAFGKLAQDGTGDYPLLAKFKQAGLLARQGKNKQAQAAYDALATGQSNPQIRDLALVLAANTLVDQGDVAGVTSRVEGLITPDNPLRNAAREAIGLADYVKKDYNGALKMFQAVIDDPNAPQGIRGRMRLFSEQLIAQGATLPTPPATSAAAGTLAGGSVATDAAKATSPDNAAPVAPAATGATGAASAPATPAPNDNTMAPAKDNTTAPAGNAATGK